MNLADLFSTLGISLLIQAVFFVFAASLKTDKVTDLSYGLTFVILAFVLLLKTTQRTRRNWLWP
jgi:steroid 5-alpha reductase family enzyme